MNLNISFLILDIMKLKSPKSEVFDIIIAWLAISFCFAIALGNFNIVSKLFSQTAISFSFSVFFPIFGLSLVVTGTSFILHELAHKYTAIHYGAQARFIMWPIPLVLAIVIAILFGFVFVAPGAVYIFGKRLSTKEEGLTSMAGPLLNIGMAFVFMLLGVFGVSLMVVSYGVFINLWIALFNLIPIGPLDGKKVIVWNPVVWIVMFLVPILFLFVF